MALRPWLLAVLVLTALFMGDVVFAQTWTYQGSQICFQSGPGNSMCFSQGTLTSTATSVLQSRITGSPNARNGSAEGAAIGSLVGTLIATWINHHRQVKAEEKALKQQLLTSIDARIEILTEAKKLDEDASNRITALKVVDKNDLQMWESSDNYYKQMLSLDDQSIQLAGKARSTMESFSHLKSKDWESLLVTEKQLYTTSLQVAAKAYVSDEIYRAVEGSYRTQNGSGQVVTEQQVNDTTGRTVPEQRSLVVTVDSVQGFAHEKRCAGEFCDGFIVSAHNDSVSYVLICANHYYGESERAKQYNESSRAKNCRAVRPERWAAKTDDRDFLFYSGPDVLFAEYEVSSENKR